MKPDFVVSGCLAGLKCRYDGGSNPCARVMELVRSGRAVIVCPESLSGLPVPRLPCEQKDGRVIMRDGRDVTAEFERGAASALQKALASGCKKAILKAHSPSCGINRIYDGSFSKRLVKGNGVFAQKLIDAGFEIQDENGEIATASIRN